MDHSISPGQSCWCTPPPSYTDRSTICHFPGTSLLRRVDPHPRHGQLSTSNLTRHGGDWKPCTVAMGKTLHVGGSSILGGWLETGLGGGGEFDMGGGVYMGSIGCGQCDDIVVELRM